MSTFRWGRRSRRSFTYWLVAVTLALAGGWMLLAAAHRAETAQAHWGTTQAVLVATRPLPAGTVIQPGDIAPVSWPGALVPPGATLGSPVGRTVTAAVLPGEALNDARLDGGGPAGALAAGQRAVALPLQPGHLALAAGDQVDLVGIDGAGQPRVLSGGGLVLAADDTTLTVAVPVGDAPDVAAGVAAGTVVPLLRPPGQGRPSPPRPIPSAS